MCVGEAEEGNILSLENRILLAVIHLSSQRLGATPKGDCRRPTDYFLEDRIPSSHADRAPLFFSFNVLVILWESSFDHQDMNVKETQGCPRVACRRSRGRNVFQEVELCHGYKRFPPSWWGLSKTKSFVPVTHFLTFPSPSAISFSSLGC